jgi:hypothetical protein
MQQIIASISLARACAIITLALAVVASSVRGAPLWKNGIPVEFLCSQPSCLSRARGKNWWRART